MTVIFVVLLVLAVGLGVWKYKKSKSEEQGSEETKKCRECLADVPKKAKKCQHCGSKQPDTATSWVAVGVLLFFALIVAVSLFDAFDAGDKISSPSVPQQNSKEAEATESKELLELLDWRCYEEYSYFHIVGEVKNISDKPLESVVAIGSAYSDDGTFVKSDETLIDYNPVLPGQTSPFEVSMTGNPAISKCKIKFKEFWGGAIPTKRSR